MAKNKHYKKIIELLSQNSYLTREQILEKIKVKSNGTITAVLNDLEKSSFIASYTPLNNENSSRLVRYCLKDAYLNYYYNFIYPKRANILHTDSQTTKIKSLNMVKLQQTLGYAFERWCRFNPNQLARCMEFEQIDFESGAYFSRKLEQKGIQIDLIFKRADYRLVICEIKYSAPTAIASLANQLMEKATLLKQVHEREFKKYTIELALIVGTELSDENKYKNHFDYVVDLKALLV